MTSIFDLGQPHRPAPSAVAAAPRTLGDLFRERVRLTPDAAATFQKVGGRWRRTSWRELYDLAARAARAFVELGVAPGERIAVLGPTHTEWAVYDLGAHLAGIVSVGIYPLQTAEQVRYLLEHSESRVVLVAEPSELQTVLEAAKGNPHLRAIVPWSEELFTRYAEADERVLSPARMSGEPLAESEIEARQAAVDPQNTAIIIYTSGTTGPPKGAMITHANILALMGSVHHVIDFHQDDLLISFLPMAHATERVLGLYSRVNAGAATAFASSIGAVLEELREVRPTIFGSVPRLFEKAYARVQGELAKKPAAVRAIFDWALAVGKRRARCLIAQEPVPALCALQYRLATALVFRKIQAAFGGRVRLCVTGAAPIALDILEFFWAAGLPIYEGYGMTEATVTTHFNRQAAVRLGSVGKPIPPTEHRIASDGEILLGGPFVFKGYFKDPAATAEALQDGWLATGDIGEQDADGFLRITDRKKHLIVTAGGKNVAPANIERAIKNQSPFISHVHAHGDRRNYIAALIAPSPLETLEWGAAKGVLSQSEHDALRSELLANPSARSAALNAAMARIAANREFQQLFLEPVKRGNRELARVERVRRFFVLDRDLSQEEGEITPTLKLKRKAVETKFAELFDRLYDDPGFGLEAEGEG